MNEKFWSRSMLDTASEQQAGCLRACVYTSDSEDGDDVRRRGRRVDVAVVGAVVRMIHSAG